MNRIQMYPKCDDFVSFMWWVFFSGGGVSTYPYKLLGGGQGTPKKNQILMIQFENRLSTLFDFKKIHGVTFFNSFLTFGAVRHKVLGFISNYMHLGEQGTTRGRPRPPLSHIYCRECSQTLTVVEPSQLPYIFFWGGGQNTRTINNIVVQLHSSF